MQLQLSFRRRVSPDKKTNILTTTLRVRITFRRKSIPQIPLLKELTYTWLHFTSKDSEDYHGTSDGNPFH